LTPAKNRRKKRGGGFSALSLNGVLAGPLPSCGFVAGSVGLVDVGDFGDQWVVGVGVGEHGADGEEDCFVMDINICDSRFKKGGEDGWGRTYL
jgi:hypothetical protein